MRCPDCNKFVSMDSEQDPEVELEVNEDGGVAGTVRIVNSCADCSTELTEASFDVEVEVPKEADGHSGDGHDLTVEVTSEERTERYVGKGRYAQHFYGFSAEYKMTCACGGLSIDGQVQDDIQASYMDSLV